MLLLAGNREREKKKSRIFPGRSWFSYVNDRRVAESFVESEREEAKGRESVWRQAASHDTRKGAENTASDLN